MSDTKRNLLIRLITIVVLAMLTGILLLVINGKALVTLVFIILGALLLIDGITGLIGNEYSSKYTLITNIISIALGALLMFNFHTIVNILIAIWFIVFPIVNIYLNRDNAQEELKKQLPKMILGVIIIIFGIGGVIDVLLNIVGWGLIAFSVIYLVLGLTSLKKHY